MSLIRVFIIPRPSGNFHFGGGEPQTFYEVDFFRDDGYPLTPETQEAMREFIMRKAYYQPGIPLLVLGPGHSFTINYDTMLNEAGL